MVTHARLSRLLTYLDSDAGNLALRKDAIREASAAGDLQCARGLIDAGLQLFPLEAGLLALSGFAHLQAQRPAEAEQALSGAMERGEQAPEVRYNLAFACFLQGRFAQALDLLTDANVARDVPLATLLRARCLYCLGRPEEAIAECGVYLRISPDDAETHGLLGLLMQEQRRDAEARQHVDAALRQDRQQREALLALGRLQRECHEYDAARLTFDQLLHAHPECGRGWLGRGLTELSRMRFDDARRDIERAAQCQPEHIGTWHVLAWTHLLLGDLKAAQSSFDRAMELDRTFGETHGGIAVIAAMLGREDEARAGIMRALRLDPQGMSAQYAEMLLLQRHGKNEQAQKVFDAFLARQPHGSGAQFRELVAAHAERVRRSGAIPSMPSH